jgi:tRNA threonylcarbamoyladenosine biosynthesis protein TsaE
MNITEIDSLKPAAKALLEKYPDKKVFAFKGPMGSGKTTFIKAICEELGVNDTVSSPTFSLVNEYRSEKGEKVFHFDFYRIKNISEAYDMGYEDYLYSGSYCFIEWPEMIAELLPEGAVEVEIKLEGAARTISF